MIFVSADHDQESFDGYFKHMPWTALPFGDPRIEALNSLLEVEGIPTTILFDGDLYRILNKELRAVVMQDPKGEQFPWRPQPVSVLSEAFLGHINDVACALLFLPAGRKAAEFDPILRGTAARILDEAEASGKEAKIRFAIAESDNHLADSILSQPAAAKGARAGAARHSRRQKVFVSRHAGYARVYCRDRKGLSRGHAEERQRHQG